jgi:hypothetical protein
MAYYRQKYDKSATADGISKTAGSAPRIDKKNKGASQRRQKKHKPAKPQQSVENPLVSPAAAVEQEIPKKGILSRLFGAFKKKKD